MKVGDVFVRMALDNKDFRTGLAREEGFTRQKAMTLGSVFSKGFSVAMGIGLVHGFKTVGGLLTDLITTAAKTETFDIAMQAVARSSGYPIPVLQQQRKEIMALGIAEQETTHLLTRFMQAQLDTADAIKIGRVAQDAGTLAAMNSSEATKQMAEAVAKLRPELLTVFGFTRNLNDIYKDYAGTVGKTTTQLSEVEKKQAMLNYIFREGEKIAGSYEAAMGTVGKQMGSLERLELSRKLMQELKTALARPLLLPAFGYWVETMHNAFERAKAWIEANQVTLIGWGQTAKNVVAGIVRGVQWVTNAFIKNWGVIKFAATALITYAVATKTVTAATVIFRTVELALTGQLMAKIPILSIVSTAVGIYRVQMALAAAQGIVLTGVIAKIRVALYSLYSAIGPLGWILIALSLLVSGGMMLWNRYTATVNAANEAARQAYMQKLAEKQKAAAKSAMEAVKGETILADAIEKAGKAAGKSLLSFDEIHLLQQDMGGTGDIGIPDLDIADMDTSFDFGDMVGGFDVGIDEIKTSFRGLLAWLGNEIESFFVGLAHRLTDGIYKDMKMGEKSRTGGWEDWLFGKDLPIFELGGSIGWGVNPESPWEKFKTKLKSLWTTGGWASYLYSGDSGMGGPFSWWTGGEDLGAGGGGARTGLLPEVSGGSWFSNLLSEFKIFGVSAGDIWGGFTKKVTDKWEELKTNAGNTWDGIKTGIGTKWNEIKTNTSTSLGNLGSTIQTKWEEFKTNASTSWENIKSNISTKWDGIKTNTTASLENIGSTIQAKWETLKINAGNSWENIKTNITTRWDSLKRDAPIAWENIKGSISSRWEALKRDAPTAFNNIRSNIETSWNNLKINAGTIWGNIWKTIKGWIDDIKRLFSFSWSLPHISLPHIFVSWDYSGYLGKAAKFLGLEGIPRFNVSWYAQGGILTSPTLFGAGEAGREAILPLDRNTEWIDELAAKLKAGGGADEPIILQVIVGGDKILEKVIDAAQRKNARAGKTVISVGV